METTDKERSIINGTVKPPLNVISVLLRLAIKEAKIRLKFTILKFVGKYFCP